jgi:hypothetical protein
VTTLPLSILCLALIAQPGPARPARANVVDGNGKPVANARVVLYAPPVAYLKGDPVEVETKTNADGQFSLVIPPLERAAINGITFVATAKTPLESPSALPLPDPVLSAGVRNTTSEKSFLAANGISKTKSARPAKAWEVRLQP